MSIILNACSLNKSFNHNKQDPVLKDISLQIRQGEFTAIMGPSGSGKSTLLYLLSGMDSPDSGSITFLDQDLSLLSEKELAGYRLNHMGFVFQQIHMLKNLSLLDNILLSGYLAKKTSRTVVLERARYLMKSCGIADLEERYIQQVSGGQLQRAAVCRAMINKPALVFGDEPTGALNSSAASDIMNLLKEINDQGTTIVLVTHDIKVASRASRLLYMMDGSISAETSIPEADPKTREEYLIDWLKSVNF